MILVNLENFRTMTGVDPYRLSTVGMPEGFVVAEEVTTEQWIAAGRALDEKYAEETWERRP